MVVAVFVVFGALAVVTTKGLVTFAAVAAARVAAAVASRQKSVRKGDVIFRGSHS